MFCKSVLSDLPNRHIQNKNQEGVHIFNQEIVTYINSVLKPQTGVLGDIQKNALERQMPIIDNDSVCFLRTLLSIIKPKQILEIGCLVGFSAGLMCEFLQDNGHITTIDRYDIMIKEARANFERLGIENKVTLLEGDAVDILPTLKDEAYDFVFLDAAKGQYIQMLPHCLRVLKTGGVLLTDDILQGGRVAKDRLSVPRRQRTIHKRMRDFLQTACSDDALEASIVPVGDGMLLAYKK